MLKPGAAATEDELKSWCANYLAKFKVPSFVEYRADLPKTSIGKIMKYQLRADEAPPSHALASRRWTDRGRS